MPERMTKFRWWWAWEFEKLEAWLNSMVMEGWALDGVGFCVFRFVRCEPGEYTIRLEMHPHDDSYFDFMAETGAEYIGREVQWVYFRRKAELGPFDIFSDIDSRIRHLNRIGQMFSIVGLANIAIGISNSINASHLGFINLLCGCLLMYGLGRIHGKREELKRERALHE